MVLSLAFILSIVASAVAVLVMFPVVSAVQDQIDCPTSTITVITKTLSDENSFSINSGTGDFITAFAPDGFPLDTLFDESAAQFATDFSSDSVHARFNIGSLDSDPFTMTLRKNGVDTLLTMTIDGTGIIENTADLSIEEGDLISWQITDAPSGATVTFSATSSYQLEFSNNLGGGQSSCDAGKNLVWSSVGIVPVVLFFGLFSILGSKQNGS